MDLNAIAKPYSKALFDLAVSGQALPAVRREVEYLADVFGKSAELRQAFSNPVVKLEERKALAEKLGNQLRLSTLTRRFLMVLCDKRRMDAFPAIAQTFAKLGDEHMNVARAKVRSGAQLSPMQKTQLATELAKQLGKKVQIENIVDNTLIGGIEVLVDGKVFDASVRGQLERLRAEILKGI